MTKPFSVDSAGYIYQNDNPVVADVPAFVSTFLGCYPLPVLTSDPTGAHPEANNIWGKYHVGIGESALSAMTNGCLNVAIGYRTLNAAVHDCASVAIGAYALQYQNGSDASTAVGYGSLRTLVTGDFNCGFGNSTLQNLASGSNNVAIGPHAGQYATSGNDNVLVGSAAGYGLSTGGQNILIGCSVGTASYNQVTTGSTNISIGHAVAVADPTASGQLCIGNFIYGTGLLAYGTTISTAKIGLGTKAPTAELEVIGTIKTTKLTVTDAVVMMAGLPTSDPHVAGQLWANAGILTLSAG